MKKCAKCGKQNIDGAIYCAECGFKLDSSLNNSNSTSLGSNLNSPVQRRKERRNSSMKMWCCYVPIILFVGFLAVAFIYHGCAESFPVTYGHTYEYFDVDGDGRLSLEEASHVNPNIPSSNLTEYFNNADTNNNGYLKGHEYELFYDDIEFYRQHYGDFGPDSDKYEYSTSNNY